MMELWKSLGCLACLWLTVEAQDNRSRRPFPFPARVPTGGGAGGVASVSAVHPNCLQGLRQRAACRRPRTRWCSPLEVGSWTWERGSLG